VNDMFCTKCGTEIGELAKFCSQCGSATGRGFRHQPPGTLYSRLARPRDDRKVAGVCSGMARYMGIDPVLMRILAIVLTVWPPGLGPILYIICWIVMPNDPLPLSAPSSTATPTTLQT
jgi:phage shock protein C